ncbi:hypothetical protein Y032_0273g988 [Ancylostoma ceylanicum]|uniref:Uncharacterized protein n=1 Tax=Ancylostoma ceylanicum TaxID=53326 RepID=A0A016S7Y9_9BILA|nr:hypothetical protein Y032_0273g988 [Ancylostoma ceylanicum]
MSEHIPVDHSNECLSGNALFKCMVSRGLFALTNLIFFHVRCFMENYLNRISLSYSLTLDVRSFTFLFYLNEMTIKMK